MIKKRSIPLVVLLSLITFGIYPLVLLCKAGEEVNRICDGDGKNNMFYLLAWLLGIVTLGIYPLIWCSKAMNRLQDNSYRYGPVAKPQYSGGSFLLWFLLGAIIGIGPIVAFCLFVEDINAFADVYGRFVPLAYSADPVARLAITERGNLSNQFMPPQNANQPMLNSAQPQTAYSNQPINNPMQPQTAYSNQPVINSVQPLPPVGDYEQPSSLQQYDKQPQTSQNIAESNIKTAGRKSFRGTIRGVSGMYAEFDFPIENQEEIVIGSDPMQASIIIEDNGYISPKHCSIEYAAASDAYIVTDYSNGGTFDNNDSRLTPGMPKMFSRGDMIYLGTRDNTFRLG